MNALASPELCAFVRKQAPPHYATPDAPSTWRELKAWHLGALAHGSGPLCYPVYDKGCDWTIYPDPRTNHAFRAWHDSLHLANGYDFSRASEIKVGLIHMQQARKAGLCQHDLDVLVADTIGQTEYYFLHKQFVKDQARFVTDILANGLWAVLDSDKRY